MRALPGLATVLAALMLVATVVRSEGWFADHLAVVIVGSLATAFVAFNWWELWSMRDDR